MPTIAVNADTDWLQVAALGGPVVDPMIVRCGELFLRGAQTVGNRTATRDLLSKNLHGIGTFFDRLVLDEHIPVFNYCNTFDPSDDMRFDQHTLSQVNAAGEILVDVDVTGVPYLNAKSAAMAELRKLYDGSAKGITAADANNILGELTTSGYEWCPSLEGLPVLPGQESQLATYMLGGLIFGCYAERIGAFHLIQPKRSRLFIAVGLGRLAERRLEEELFAELGRLMPRTIEIPYTPTFFPYLLSQSQGPRDLVDHVLAMRKSPEVRDYRAWLRDALADYETNGRIVTSYRRDVTKIADALKKKLAGNLPAVDVRGIVTDVATGKNGDAALKAGTGLASNLWGFVVDRLPGRRYRKLLMRAFVADAEYSALERRMEAVWCGPAFA